MNNVALFSKLALLPESLQLQLAGFADYLVQKAEKEKGISVTPKPVFGSAKGMFKMRADFDEPLEDFEQYVTPWKT